MFNFGDKVERVERVEFDFVASVYWPDTKSKVVDVTSAKSSSYSAVSIQQKFR